MIKTAASSNKTNYINIFSEILNLEVHHNHCIGSKVTAILLNGSILPTGGVASGKVCIGKGLHKQLQELLLKPSIPF